MALSKNEQLPKDYETKLKQFQSPFNWEIPVIHENYIDTFLNILMERCMAVEEEYNFQWTSFIMHLVLSYERWIKKGDIVVAMFHVNHCLRELVRLSTVKCKEPLFVTIKASLWHVALATKAHLQLANGDIPSSMQLINKVKPMMKLRKEEKAGIFGIQAAVYRQYKPSGFKMSLEMARKAKLLDPKQAEWHFIIANILGRIRRLNKEVITKEELDEMQQSYVLQRDATYTGHVAQMFTDYSCYIYYNRFHPQICGFSSAEKACEVSKTYAEKAFHLYREALELRPDCPGLKVRVAHGLMRIPDLTVTDFQWAKHLMDLASLRLPNNAMLYHDLGCYYDKFEMDPDKALENLRKSHNLHNSSAFVYMVVLWWKYNVDWDLITELKLAIDKYSSERDQIQLNIFLGVTYLFLENDWEAGLKHLNKSLALDPNAKLMKKFHGFFWREQTNLLELITNELRIKIKNGENNTAYSAFLEKVLKTNPRLAHRPLANNLFESFKKSQLGHRRQIEEVSEESEASEY